MLVISVGNEKGGVAKTTLSITLSAYFAERGYRVVLVDADAQAHATWGLGLEPRPGIYDLIVRDAEYNDVLRLIPPERYSSKGASKGALMLLPGNTETGLLADYINKEGDLMIFYDRLHQLDQFIDLVIIDTSPTPSLLHTSLYYATDILLAPTEPEAFSIVSLGNTLKRVTSFGEKRVRMNMPAIRMAGIVPTMYNSNTVEHQENYKVLQTKYPDMLTAPIRQSTVWREASSHRRSIFAYAPGSAAAAEASGLAQHVEGVINA